MPEELEHCPFCGSEAQLLKLPRRRSLPDNLWVVGCDGIMGSLCPCYVWKLTPFYLSKELAAKMWNNRSMKYE